MNTLDLNINLYLQVEEQEGNKTILWRNFYFTNIFSQSLFKNLRSEDYGVHDYWYMRGFGDCVDACPVLAFT